MHLLSPLEYPSFYRIKEIPWQIQYYQDHITTRKPEQESQSDLSHHATPILPRGFPKPQMSSPWLSLRALERPPSLRLSHPECEGGKHPLFAPIIASWAEGQSVQLGEGGRWTREKHSGMNVKSNKYLLIVFRGTRAFTREWRANENLNNFMQVWCRVEIHYKEIGHRDRSDRSVGVAQWAKLLLSPAFHIGVSGLSPGCGTACSCLLMHLEKRQMMVQANEPLSPI